MAAVERVKSLGEMARPVAKTPDDLAALQGIVCEGHPRFFLGSDSAPRPPNKKSTSTPQDTCSAGIYISPILLPLVAHLLESVGALDRLQDFVRRSGQKFYCRELTATCVEKALLWMNVSAWQM
ncbi:hypothetical protein BU17DRAFT_80669 [Hysterangium stoloniferum]|nr:hypothetical protein BU17DRAFT_80649 [Hysterangium stoloniferum]KAF8528367.1 hypothetical protein BU17DRAFT_80666 [Hysterangium stoloniferum]KAF8528368.1 hypothetical protein BU17DRAFT_80669 [Hysterangium stoloniferum]